MTRALAPPKRSRPAKLEADELAVLGVVGRASRDPPLFQLLAIDGIDHAAAAGKGAKDAELAAREAGQALDGPRLVGEVGIGAEGGDPRQHAIADARGRPLILLALDHEDARRGSVLLRPSGRPGDELAIGSARRSRGRSPRAARRVAGASAWEPAISPSSAMSRKSSFSAMRSPPLMPKARAISRLPASALEPCRKSRISCLGRKPAHFRGFGSVLGLGHDSLFSTRGPKLMCRLLDGFFFFLGLASACRPCARASSPVPLRPSPR